MNMVSRNEDVIANVPVELEHLDTIKNFPIFMGCTDSPPAEDVFADMSWCISPISGAIQIQPIVPFEIIYSKQHHAGTIGSLWAEHHRTFAEFIDQFLPTHVLEIGAGHCELANIYTAIHKNVSWTVVDPNASPKEETARRIKVIREYFDETFNANIRFDAVVHSHLMEHVVSPSKFLSQLSTIPFGRLLIFSIPNMVAMLQRHYTNCINFEHTFLLSEEHVEYLLSTNGFRLLEKKYFKEDHSIFYSAERVEELNPPPLPNLYEKTKALGLSYLQYHTHLVEVLNNITARSPAYLFGAHVFSQVLFAFGLNEGRIISILDNDTKKHGLRLYGTNLQVYSPQILSEVHKPIVILKAGVYTDEIRTQLTKINSETIFV
jgi:hypothetical protein